MRKRYVPWDEINEAAQTVAQFIRHNPRPPTVVLHGIPRGGLVPVYMVAKALECCGVPTAVTEYPSFATHFIDDLVDSGRTRLKYGVEYPSTPFHALFQKEGEEWWVFPWEEAGDGLSGAEDIPVRLLQYIGEDPARGGLLETPKRFLKAWDHWSSGYQQDPADVLKVFEDGADKVDELVLVRDIPVYSHCEHHLAPFFGVAHVGYIPNGKIVGLSKLSRLVDVYARRLQVQERLTTQIAHALNEHLQPQGVGVVIRCRHLCMESRGVQRQGSSTSTSCMLGVLRDSDSARAEFMQLIRGEVSNG